MSIANPDDCSLYLKITRDQFDEIIEAAYKANALVQMALSAQLELLTSEVLYYFLWSLDDILHQLSLPLMGLESK